MQTIQLEAGNYKFQFIDAWTDYHYTNNDSVKININLLYVLPNGELLLVTISNPFEK